MQSMKARRNERQLNLQTQVHFRTGDDADEPFVAELKAGK